MRKNLILFSTAISLAFPACAFAGGPASIAGATLPEQISQEATLIDSLAKQAESVQQQIQQTMDMARNLASLPQNVLSQISGQVSQLVSIVGQSDSLSYAMQNVDSSFQSQYQDFTPDENYSDQYQQWSQNTNGSIENALNNQGLQASDFASESSALQRVTQLSQSGTGAMQVLQAGNQISGMVVQQLQKMRQLQMSDSDAQLAYIKQQQEVQKQAVQERQQQVQQFEQWSSQNPNYSVGSATIGLPQSN